MALGEAGGHIGAWGVGSRQLGQQRLLSRAQARPFRLLTRRQGRVDNGRRWDSEEPLQIGRNVYPNEELIILPDTSEMVAVVKIHESLGGTVNN